MPIITIVGKMRKPNIGEDLSTTNTAIRVRRKIDISQILNIFCMSTKRYNPL
jgi:hypothetical protein